MRNVAFDIDGVIADTYDVIRIALKQEFGINFPKNEHRSFYFDVPNASSKDVIRVIDKCMIEDFNDVKPLGDSIYILKRVFLMTRKPLLFVTARPEACREGTISWLKKYLGRFVDFNVILTENKPKTRVLLDLNIELFVDDRYKTINELSNIIDMPLMLNSPWNEGRPTPQNTVRIDDLEEVIHYL